jgi:hypothetical protein
MFSMITYCSASTCSLPDSGGYIFEAVSWHKGMMQLKIDPFQEPDNEQPLALDLPFHQVLQQREASRHQPQDIKGGCRSQRLQGCQEQVQGPRGYQTYCRRRRHCRRHPRHHSGQDATAASCGEEPPVPSTLAGPQPWGQERGRQGWARGG